MKVFSNQKSYVHDVSGNFSVMFAVGSAMLLLAAGAAVDIAGMVQSRTQYQDVSDAAVLAAVRSGETNQEKLLEVAQATMDLLLNDTSDGKIELNLMTDGSQVTVELSAPHENYFMGMFGYDNSQISVESVSIIPGHINKNIAFVLDTTDSMAGTKLTTLKSAMSNFIDAMEPALATNNAKISIVPFADYVRIPMSFASASWINIQPPEEITYNVLDGENSVNCRTEGSGEGQYTVCDDYVYIEKTTVTEWKGCMGSRPAGYHKVVDYQSKTFPGFNGSRAECYSLFNYLLPLTSNVGEIETAITDLESSGFTYIPAGLIWGWRTLSPNEPFTEAFASPEGTENLLVLMTDGANSKNLDDTVYDETLYHFGTANSATEGYEAINAAESNPLTSELCELIKADNIEIATIAYEVTDADALKVLRLCASRPSNFYNANNANALKQAFKDIGAGNSEVRLVR